MDIIKCGGLDDLFYGNKRMADESKTGSDKQGETPEKIPEKSLTPEGSPQQQKADSDAQRLAQQRQPGTVTLPEITIAGTDAKAGNAKPTASEGQTSWSTQDLSRVLKYLDSIKPAAERTLGVTDSAGDRAQRNTYILLRDKILPELKSQGKIGAEWQLFPTTAQSPADKVGADYLLVNTKTGAFHLLDATLKENKGNVFALRAGGVIVVDNRLFDALSALKTTDGGAIGEAATQLKTDISQQITSLTKSNTPFKLGPDGTPMPSVTIVSEQKAKSEITKLSEWAKAEAKASTGNEARLFNEMSSVVEGSFRHLDKAAREIASPKLAESVSRATDAEIAKYALAKYKGEKYDAAKPGAAANNLHVLKDGKLVMPVQSGEIHVGGNFADHLEKSWGSLQSEKKLLSLLSNKDLKAMGADTTSFEKLSGEERAEAIYKAYRSQRQFQNEANKLRNTLHSEQQVIKAGGALGTGAPVIAENIMARLRARPDSTLLGIAPKPEAAAAPDKPAIKTAFSDIDKTASKPIEALAEFSGLEKHDNKVSSNLSTSMELLLADQQERRAKDPTAKDLWTQVEFDRFTKLNEAYSNPSHPDHADSVKQLHDLLNKKVEMAESEAEKAQAVLQGNPIFEKLTDETRMKEAVKQLSDRTKTLPAQDKDEYLAKQIKEALRKQTGAATLSELPESVRQLKVKMVEGSANSVRVNASGVLEIPSKLLRDDPKKAVAEAYAHASGMSMLDLLRQEGNEHLTMRSLKPMLSKIAERAETVVTAQLESAKTNAHVPINSEAASTERKTEIPKERAIVTSWNGEILNFGNEKFNVSSELAKLNRERAEKIKALETEFEKAQKTAESKQTDENKQRVTSLEQQLIAERQNSKIATDLHQSLTGSRGAEAQSKAQTLIKQAAERAAEQHMSKRGGSATFSRASAIALLLSTATALYVQGNGPARADVYETHIR